MGRSPCCDEVGLKKGPWTAEEDRKLIRYVTEHGHGSWRALPKLAGLNRCGKSCRLRWTNYLRPDIKRGKFTEEEEHRVIELHSTLGNKWSAIAKHLPGRTDNEIKNYWNTHIRKKLIQMGIDPITHQQRADLSLLANLPSLLALSAANSTGLPLDGAFRLQSNAEQLARINLAQTLVQILAGGVSSCALPAMDDPSGQAGVGFIPNQMSNNIINPNSHGLPQFHNRISPPSLYTSQQQVSNIPTDIGNTRFATTTNSTPSLVSASPEDVAVNQMSGFKNLNNNNMSNVKLPTNEPWEGLELGDISGDSYWKDILDQVSSPAWNILQS